MIQEAASLDRRLIDLIGCDADQLFMRVSDVLTDECGVHMSWIARPVAGGVVIHNTSGNLTQCSRGVFLREGRGLGGKVFATQRLQYVDDYVTASSITHDYDGVVTPENLGRMVGAPLLFGGRNYGVLFAGYRGTGECGTRCTSMLESVAHRVAEGIYFLDRLRESTDAAVREARRGDARVFRAHLSASLASSLERIRETEAVAGGDAAVTRKLREIERTAIASNAALLQSLDDLADDGAAVCGAPGPLAKREYEVLCRVSVGETNAEIGHAMNLSFNTVKSYLRNAMTKLEARNRVEAVVKAKALGLM